MEPYSWLERWENNCLLHELSLEDKPNWFGCFLGKGLPKRWFSCFRVLVRIRKWLGMPFKRHLYTSSWVWNASLQNDIKFSK
jgi:hypothetical protein